MSSQVNNGCQSDVIVEFYVFQVIKKAGFRVKLFRGRYDVLVPEKTTTTLDRI
jgi:hypothetical protein